MRFQRAVSVLTLLTFLPLATGCTTSKVAQVNAEPEVGREGQAIDAYEEPVEINAYTLVDGQRHEWRGTIEASGLDSLEFKRKVEPASGASGAGNAPPIRAEVLDGGPEYESRSLAKVDVVSIERRVFSGANTTLLVIGIIAGIIAALSQSESDGTSTWSQDPVWIAP